REHVRWRRPDVAAAVAVVVLRVAQVARRHELHLAHRAGPRSLQVVQVDIAAIQDLERVEQLAAKERRAARIPRERGEGRRGRAGPAAVGRRRRSGACWDPTPKLAAMFGGGTGWAWPIPSSGARWRRYPPPPAVISLAVNRRATYCSSDNTVSACDRSRSRMT